MRSARVSVALVAVLVGTSCRAGDPPTPPATLSDGSAARPPPVELEGVEEPVVATRGRVAAPGVVSRDSASARCIGSVLPRSVRRATRSVERVDVHGGSVTFLGPEGTTLHGCDSSTADSGSWCGRAFAVLDGGRLRDPRLSIGCRDGDVIGYAWIEPARSTEWVVIRHEGYREAYPVLDELPVRVATEDVDLMSSRARFDVSEHRRDGDLNRAYELRAAVSG